jgi:hypothetical protein
MVLVVVVVVLPIWGISQSAGGVVALAAVLIGVCGMYLRAESHRFGGVTLTSCFVTISGFVFGSRAIYIALNDDFSIMNGFGLPGSHAIVIDAMAYVTICMVAYIMGAMALCGKVLRSQRLQLVAVSRKMAALNLTPLYLYGQIGLTVLLLPYGLGAVRSAIYETSDSAYIYLLPTLAHGFDLYFFTHIFSRWWGNRTAGGSVAVLVWFGLTIFHAYLLSNMSPFRGYYLAGLAACAIAFLLIIRHRVSWWFLVGIFAIYPLFKSLGSARAMTNSEMIAEVVLQPTQAYTSDGLKQAFGQYTDLNMLDTLTASLAWEHNRRPYLLSFFYPLVHWIPRSWWKSKPTGGVLADLGYVYSSELKREVPYSPGIIGFLNDDGGKIYMIGAMFLLGIFMRGWELFVLRLQTYEMQIAIWAALFFAALVTVRFLPYQIFYQFLIFIGPCWVCDRFMLKRAVQKRIIAE